MTTATVSKQGLYQAIESLPPKSLDELAQFVDYLAHKYQVPQGRRVVALSGLWKDLDFDVEDGDVRELRQKVSAQLAGKM